MATVATGTLDRVGHRREELSSDAHLELGLRNFFARNWLFVARRSRLGKPGCFCRFRLGSQNILVVHDEDGDLNARHNVCRHRGAELPDQDSGNCGRTISCHYRGWAYAHNGTRARVVSPRDPPPGAGRGRADRACGTAVTLVRTMLLAHPEAVDGPDLHIEDF